MARDLDLRLRQCLCKTLPEVNLRDWHVSPTCDRHRLFMPAMVADQLSFARREAQVRAALTAGKAVFLGRGLHPWVRPPEAEVASR